MSGRAYVKHERIMFPSRQRPPDTTLLRFTGGAAHRAENACQLYCCICRFKERFLRSTDAVRRNVGIRKRYYIYTEEKRHVLCCMESNAAVPPLMAPRSQASHSPISMSNHDRTTTVYAPAVEPNPPAYITMQTFSAENKNDIRPDTWPLVGAEFENNTFGSSPQSYHIIYTMSSKTALEGPMDELPRAA